MELKNEFELRGNETAIFIHYHGVRMETIIDTKDLAKSQSIKGKWYPYWNKKTKSYYVYGSSGRNFIQLHRLIMDNPAGYLVDHINHDTLCNKKMNLRCANNAENMQNLKKAYSNSKSGVLGVTWNNCRQKWECQIVIKGKHIYREFFDGLEEASKSIKSARSSLLSYS
jgi:hypothetical protein